MECLKLVYLTENCSHFDVGVNFKFLLENDYQSCNFTTICDACDKFGLNSTIVLPLGGRSDFLYSHIFILCLNLHTLWDLNKKKNFVGSFFPWTLHPLSITAGGSSRSHTFSKLIKLIFNFFVFIFGIFNNILVNG